MILESSDAQNDARRERMRETRVKGPHRRASILLFRNGETISQITLRSSADSCTRNLHMINNHARRPSLSARDRYRCLPLICSRSRPLTRSTAPLSKINPLEQDGAMGEGGDGEELWLKIYSNHVRASASVR